jgi:predicted AAA+ superfamily ATPase
VVELNLERDPGLSRLFADSDPRATLRRLEAYSGQTITASDEQLLFIDEIQAAPDVLAKLRWFAEELPALPIIAAGSLLDFALAEHTFSMPVGRISFLHLEPMGFEEFLLALGEESLLRLLTEELTASAVASGEPFPPALHGKLLDLLRQYVLVGGMPEAVAEYAERRSLVAVGNLHRDLLATLRDDFAKYAGRVPHQRLTTVLDAVPRQLGGKFRYSRADRDERAAALRQAVDLLCLARVCHRVQASAAAGLPLAAASTGRAYKLILLDVGLAASLLGLSLMELERGVSLTLVNQGAMAEQLAGQLLRLTVSPHQEPALYYWAREARGSEAEVDYVIQHGSRIVPVEVKAGSTGTLKSLHILMAERGWHLAARLNGDLPSMAEVAVRTRTEREARYRLLSLPLYSIEQLPRLLGEI